MEYLINFGHIPSKIPFSTRYEEYTKLFVEMGIPYRYRYNTRLLSDIIFQINCTETQLLLILLKTGGLIEQA